MTPKEYDEFDRQMEAELEELKRLQRADARLVVWLMGFVSGGLIMATFLWWVL